MIEEGAKRLPPNTFQFQVEVTSTSGSYPSRNSYYSLSQHFSRSFKCRYAGR